ncbi:unnamed protein product [Dracunculus medinensis]|uniref:Ubiquitin-like domain-containing protein n=1 Tax=Dracunculus medinensis TaxID=318479 RepID=A0A158Q2P2_DRAME|nr:unnamed protein product [Dracunculus medinensis]
MVLFAITVFVVAWRSTFVPANDYHVWLVQMQIYPSRRIFQVLQFDRHAFVVIDNRYPLHLEISNLNVRYSYRSIVDLIPTSIRNMLENYFGHLHSALSGNEERSHITQAPVSSHSQGSNETERTFEQMENGSEVAANQIAVPNINNLPEDTEFMNNELANAVSLSHIKIKFLDDSESVVSTALNITVGNFKRHFFCKELSSGKVVRLIFRGQLLHDDSKSLLNYGLFDYCVVHCVIGAPTSLSTSISNSASLVEEPNLANHNGISIESATSAIAAIAGSQSVANASSQEIVTRQIQQAHHEEPIRLRNQFLRGFRVLYNAILGPDPNEELELSDEIVDPFHEAINEQTWNQDQESPDSFSHLIGHYLYLIFSDRRRTNDRSMFAVELQAAEGIESDVSAPISAKAIPQHYSTTQPNIYK